MFGGLGNLAGLMKQAKSLQANMKKMEEALLQQRYEAEAGAGMVRVVVNGKTELVDIKIDPEATGDVELLEDTIKAALAAAVRKAHDGAKAEMAKLTGGLNLPGLGGLTGEGS